MNTEELLTALGQDINVKVLNVQDGDTLVLLIPTKIYSETAVALKERIQAAFPGVPALILDSGMSLGVVRSQQP